MHAVNAGLQSLVFQRPGHVSSVCTVYHRSIFGPCNVFAVMKELQSSGPAAMQNACSACTLCCDTSTISMPDEAWQVACCLFQTFPRSNPMLLVVQALTQSMDGATQAALQGMIQYADTTKAKAQQI